MWETGEGVCSHGRREQLGKSPGGRLQTGRLGWVVMVMGMD